MRLAVLTTLAFVSGTWAAAPNVDFDDFNRRILDYCRSQIGRKVGNGQCTELAHYAILNAGAKSPDEFEDAPRPGDYVWGELIFRYRQKGRRALEEGGRRDVLPGDIIQMRNVIIEHEEQKGEWTTVETIDADHHTAVISRVADDGYTYEVIEQNSNEVPVVGTGRLHLRDMKRGYILVYRAVPN